MRILVTGGTGYVGSHAVAALVQGGHEVRLLVRSVERIAPALSPLGVQDVAHTLGDVNDAASVDRALKGCEAVVHAASVYSLDARDAATMKRVNVPGTEIVLDAAAQRGLDPIVYVSSTVAFAPGDGSPAGPDSPVGTPAGVYGRSKADAERAARLRQERGDPVAIVYPGAVYGPCDPHLGEQLAFIRDFLKRRFPALPRGGLHSVDVREVAATIEALIRAGQGARRHVVPGHHATFREVASHLEAITGRRLPSVSLPASALRPSARAAERLQRLVPFRIRISAEGLYFTGCDLRFDDSRARRELGISPRPFAETLADSVRWLCREGHIRPREAGDAFSDGQTT
jgi:nucleoside-diphosphate-sugar epimerase